MQYLLLGFAALVLGLLALRYLSRAQPGRLARSLVQGLGLVLIVLAALMAARGVAMAAAMLASLGAWLLLSPQRLAGSMPPDDGQRSRVVTDYLEMELDHDSGAMEGRVRKGVFEGRRLDAMAPAELALLWQDCRFDDPPSARLVEAYLDHVHPTWREDLARAEEEPGVGGKMGPDEAYEILGLEPGATADDIRRAHRELMVKLHPDKGGSSYLAAKVNEAKDLLLERASGDKG